MAILQSKISVAPNCNCCTISLSAWLDFTLLGLYFAGSTLVGLNFAGGTLLAPLCWWHFVGSTLLGLHFAVSTLLGLHFAGSTLLAALYWDSTMVAALCWLHFAGGYTMIHDSTIQSRLGRRSGAGWRPPQDNTL